MTTLSRRQWLQKSAMAAAILPITGWYDPFLQTSKYYSQKQYNSDGAIRLGLNENAYGPSESAKKAIIESLSEANRYPRQFISDLKAKIAARENLTPDHVMITAGSTELLGLAGLYFGLHGGEMLACHPTFDFLMAYSETLGCKWDRTPLTADHQYDLEALSSKTSGDTKLIFVCNPNNPTGVEIPYPVLQDFCKSHAAKYPVYIDEAYIELSPNGHKSSMSHLIQELPKLIVARTFSKVFGLAGMRIGYALAQPEVIKGMTELHTGRSITLSNAGAAAAMACMDDKVFENFSRTKIIEGREMTSKAFTMWGVDHLPSAANFIFFKNDKFSMDPVKAFAQDNIFIRSYDYYPGWTRVSIGTTEEMSAFILAGRKYLA